MLKLKKPWKSAAEILAGAMEIWNGGKGWCRGALRYKEDGYHGDRYCLLGGINQAAGGHPFFGSFNPITRLQTRRAKKLIARAIQKSGWGRDVFRDENTDYPKCLPVPRPLLIADWNDRHGFSEVKQLVCEVIKKEVGE